MDIQKYSEISEEAKRFGAKLIAVSKTKPVEDILELYHAGQKYFGENKVQEMVDKYEALPKDIEWHLIGHLQTNKVKYIASFVSCIHAVDSLRLLEEIDKQAAKNSRVIDCLLQVHIAEEETKFGFDANQLFDLPESNEFASLSHIRICGLMGMATNTADERKIESEFQALKQLFDKLKKEKFAENIAFRDLSMGMSSDYKIALRNGSTLIRVGSVIFGER
jgi:pyridoxal phosphate enzyme (YggS family)